MANTYHTDVVMDDDTVITTTVTRSGYQVAHFLREFQWDANLIVGLDAEWRPNFRSGGRQNVIAVLQLCIGHSCLVYQIIHSESIPAALQEFLLKPSNQFVGVGIDDDAQRLYDDYRLGINNTVDLRHLAAEKLYQPDLRQAGLKRLALEVLGVHIEKPQRVTLSNWEAWSLTQEQVDYASIDAFVSYQIGRRLLSGYY